MLSIIKTTRARRGKASPFGPALLVVAGMIAALGVVLVLPDHLAGRRLSPEARQQMLMQDQAARGAAIERWRVQKPRLAQALKQKRLELGAVWATRDGRVCGLVNGWGSFGGLTGMTQFYTDGDRFMFSARRPQGFHTIWQGCQADRWQSLHVGSEERGFCGTRLGRKRCAEEEGWTRYP